MVVHLGRGLALPELAAPGGHPGRLAAGTVDSGVLLEAGLLLA